MSKRKKISEEFVIKYMVGRYELELENIKTQNYAIVTIQPDFSSFKILKKT